MPRKFQFIRGLKKNLPTLSQGEIAFTTDEKSTYIGDGSQNVRLLDQKDKSEITTQLEGKATIKELEALASGSPKGVFATLNDLQNEFPNGTTGVHLLTADGKWYYWNDSEWTAGGLYLTNQAADGLENVLTKQNEPWAVN